MLGIKVNSAVKCHLFTPPWPAPAAEQNPRGNTVCLFKKRKKASIIQLQTRLIIKITQLV